MATAFFLEKIIDMTDAQCDQDHIDMIIYHIPSIPDRTAYILDRSMPDPGKTMIDAARQLEQDGVDAIAIPCVTAHYFRDRIDVAVRIPVLNGVSQTAEYLREHGKTRVGIMATDGTVESGLFTEAFEGAGISCIYPDGSDQKRVMGLIYDNVKAGKDADLDIFYDISGKLTDRGAQVVLLGCTELSVVAAKQDIHGPFLDVLDVLACSCVSRFGKVKLSKKTLFYS